MMNRHVITSHRGFVLPLLPSEGGESKYVSLPLVDQLYERVRTTSDFHRDFEFVQSVIVAAKRILYGQEGFTIARQLKVPGSRWTHAFAISTIGYLNGIPRKMSLENFRDLLAPHPTRGLTVNYREVIDTYGLTDMTHVDLTEVLRKWMSTPEGLTDLVVTLELMAGSLPANWKDFSETEVLPAV